jgi:hypothetical protein
LREILKQLEKTKEIIKKHRRYSFRKPKREASPSELVDLITISNSQKKL